MLRYMLARCIPVGCFDWSMTLRVLGLIASIKSRFHVFSLILLNAWGRYCDISSDAEADAYLYFTHR